MKAVIYARYSSDNQREESIEGQLRECMAFAQKNDITVLRNYIDRAFSAKTDNRPAFQEMIRDSSKKLFDVIIVWKLDRFARNRYDSARYKAALKKNGVKVVSATEVISEGAEGIILESVLEGYAEYYSADLSEKVVRGMTENALKGKFNGGNLPIGYVVDAEQHLQIDPLTAPFVLEAYKRYADGATMTQIRDWLNEQGVRNKRGLPMNYNSVQLMLHNRRYIGEFRYRDIVDPTGIPPIVPEDLFDRVQERMEKNKKAPARHKAEDDYLLTTKLFCGYCGAYLCGEAGTSHTDKVYHYYKCVSAKKHRGCHKKTVRKNWLEDLVVEETMKMLNDDKVIEAIVSMVMDLQNRENTTLPMLEQQLHEAETGIQNMLNAIQQGIFTKSTKTRLEELEAAKEELESKIANEKLEKPRIPAEFVTFWLERFRKLDVSRKEHRKVLIDNFVNAIYLYNDKLVLTFNYKDGTKTVTFDETKDAVEKAETGSDLDCLGAPSSENTVFSGLFHAFKRQFDALVHWILSAGLFLRQKGGSPMPKIKINDAHVHPSISIIIPREYCVCAFKYGTINIVRIFSDTEARMNRIAHFDIVSREQFEKDWAFELPCPYDDLKLPARGTAGSAGYDFYSPLDFTLQSGEFIKIPTGMRVKIDDGWVLMLFPRSGQGFKYRLQLYNTVGVIDADYYGADNEGHMFVKIVNANHEGKAITVRRGEAFAQGIFLPFGVTDDDAADAQRTGGFGSTDQIVRKDI